MSKKRKLNFKFVLLVFSMAILLFYGCQDDEDFEVTSNKMTRSEISQEKLLDNIKDLNLQNFILGNNHLDNSNNFYRNSSENPIFEMIVKPNVYINYSLKLNNYSTEKPYFKYFVINKDAISEKAGFIYYYPSSSVSKINANNFTGRIIVYDIEGHLTGETNFINSIPTINNPGATNRGVECTTSYFIGVVNCSHGGEHPPGSLCDDGSASNGYYEIRSNIKCSWKSLVAPPEVVAGFSGGGGGSVYEKTPCEKLKKLQSDNGFRGRMGNLASASAQWNFEKCYTIYKSTANPVPFGNEYTYQDFSGTNSAPQVSYTGNTSMQGVIHSHYVGASLSIFSVTDLVDLYEKMKIPEISDDFFIGVVCPQGNAYLMQVQDRAAFIAFGDKYLNNKNNQDNFTVKILEKKYDVKMNNSASENEKGFLKMMKELNIGANLAKETFDPSPNAALNSNLFKNWKKVSYNTTTNEVESNNCN